MLAGNYVYWSKFSNDFGVYWRTANMPVEMAYLWKGRFPFPYAPTMLLWIQPLSLVPKWPAYFVFVSASLAAFVWVLRPYLSKAELALTLISPAVARGLFTGQVCAAISAVMIWACGTGNRIAAGIAFGIVASIKPQLVLMAPLMFVLNRDTRAFIAAGATFSAIVALSLALFGFARWPEWLASMDHFERVLIDYEVIKIGISPAAIAVRYGLEPLPFMLAGALVGAGIVYLKRDSDPLEKAAAIGLGSLMAAPYALTYDLSVVMPIMAIAAMKGSILSPIGMVTNMRWLTLLIAVYELLKKSAIPFRRFRNATV